MVICLQCAMRAQIADRPYQGETDPTIEQHMMRVHPDPIETQRERRELERKLAARVAP